MIEIVIKTPDILRAAEIISEALRASKEEASTSVKKEVEETIISPIPAEPDIPFEEPVKVFTQQEVSLAGARLIQKDRALLEPVHALLSKYGVKATVELQGDALQSFAKELIGLGADING